MPTKHYFIGLEEIWILAPKYPPQMHIGTDGWKGKDSDGKMRIVSTVPEQVDPVHTCQSGLGQHEKHFSEAYKNLLILGREVGDPGTIMNAQELSDEEDNSINTITDVMST